MVILLLLVVVIVMTSSYWLWCRLGDMNRFDLKIVYQVFFFLETSTFWDAVFRTSQKIGSNFINCRSRNWDNMILTDCWTWQRKDFFSRYWLRALKATYFQLGWKANSTCLGDWSSPHSGGATTSTLIRSGGLRRWGSRNLQQKKT